MMYASSLIGHPLGVIDSFRLIVDLSRHAGSSSAVPSDYPKIIPHGVARCIVNKSIGSGKGCNRCMSVVNKLIG